MSSSKQTKGYFIVCFFCEMQNAQIIHPKTYILYEIKYIKYSQHVILQVMSAQTHTNLQVN